jgi:hypothetical protein
MNLVDDNEVLTGVIVKASVSSDITPCSPLKFNQVSKENITAILRSGE